VHSKQKTSFILRFAVSSFVSAVVTGDVVVYRGGGGDASGATFGVLAKTFNNRLAKIYNKDLKCYN
jgi:hypothetical protein